MSSHWSSFYKFFSNFFFPFNPFKTPFTQHSIYNMDKLKIKPEKIYNCPNCQFSFKRSEHLNRHVLTHSKLRPFPCNVCPQKFARFDALKRHSHKMHNLNMSIKDYRQISNSFIWNAYQNSKLNQHFNSSSSTIFSSVSPTCSSNSVKESVESSSPSGSPSGDSTNQSMNSLASVCYMEQKRLPEGRVRIEFLLN